MFKPATQYLSLKNTNIKINGALLGRKITTLILQFCHPLRWTKGKTSQEKKGIMYKREAKIRLTSYCWLAVNNNSIRLQAVPNNLACKRFYISLCQPQCKHWKAKKIFKNFRSGVTFGWFKIFWDSRSIEKIILLERNKFCLEQKTLPSRKPLQKNWSWILKQLTLGPCN